MRNKYIHNHNGKYGIHKVIDGKCKCFGVFDDVNVACKVRDMLVGNGWNLDTLLYRGSVYRYCDGFVILHLVNGRVKCFGSFDTYSEACRVKGLLVRNNWVCFDFTHGGWHVSSGRDLSNIFSVGCRFGLKKMIDGEVFYFGLFDSLDDAIVERDFLRSCDFDLEEVCSV